MPVTIGGSGPITGVTSINTSVSDTELGYLDGVSSALQTQINAKANDSSQGLYLITPTSIANSGGSASLSGNTVTFSGVSSVSLNGCFTGSYDNYRVLISEVTSSVNDTAIGLRLRASGADNSSSNYTWSWVYGGTATAGASGSRSGTSANVMAGSSAIDCGGSFDIRSPQRSAKTTWAGNSNQDSGVNHWSYTFGGTLNVTSQFDGFTIFPASGTFSGRLAVYGYKK